MQTDCKRITEQEIWVMCSAKTNKSSSDFIFGSVSSSSSLSSSELQTRFILQPCSLLHCVTAAMEKQIFSLLSPLLYLPPSSHKTYTSTPHPSSSKWDPRSIKTWRGSHFRRISCQVSMQPWLSTHWSCCFFFCGVIPEHKWLIVCATPPNAVRKRSAASSAPQASPWTSLRLRKTRTYLQNSNFLFHARNCSKPRCEIYYMRWQWFHRLWAYFCDSFFFFLLL